MNATWSRDLYAAQTSARKKPRESGAFRDKVTPNSWSAASDPSDSNNTRNSRHHQSPSARFRQLRGSFRRNTQASRRTDACCRGNRSSLPTQPQTFYVLPRNNDVSAAERFNLCGHYRLSETCPTQRQAQTGQSEPITGATGTSRKCTTLHDLKAFLARGDRRPGLRSHRQP